MFRKSLGLIAAIFVIGLASPLLADGNHSCSFRSAAGNWSYRLAGSVLTDPDNSDLYPSDAPVAGVGTFTLDRYGNVTGGGPYKAGNGYSHITFSGTYTVADDCTGSVAVDVVVDGQDQGEIDFDLVFGDNANHVHWLARAEQLVLNLDATRLFHD